MKQRVKLGLALLTDVQLVLLDEPLTNLDKAGSEWYYGLINQYGDDKIIVVGSNREDEYSFCKNHIDVLAFK